MGGAAHGRVRSAAFVGTGALLCVLVLRSAAPLLPPPPPREAQSAEIARAPALSGNETDGNDAADGSCETFARHYGDEEVPGERGRFAVVTYSDGGGAKTGHYCKVRANHCAYAAETAGTDCVDNRNLGRCMHALALQSFHLISPPAWAKVSLLQHCCQHYEYVVFLDADMLVLSPEHFPVSRLAELSQDPTRSVIMTGTGTASAPFNSGMIGLRCNGPAAAHNFLRDTLAGSRGAWRHHGLWEQRTMTRLYASHAGYRAVVHPLLPEASTQCYPKSGTCGRDVFIVHFLGDRRKYDTLFLRYFCMGSLRSRALDAMYPRVCTRVGAR